MERDDSLTPPPEAVVEALVRAARAINAITARTLAAVNGEVTLPQFRTLVVLAEMGPKSVTALAELLDVHASTMTRMCTRLVTRRLVVREPSRIDRREVVIQLSDEGRTLVERAMQERREAFAVSVRSLSGDEQRAIVAALDTLTQAAGLTTAELGLTSDLLVASSPMEEP
jgi:DNA-binding MarR family transcriptional regulator